MAASSRSGYQATMTVSGAIASATDIRVEINHEPVEVTTLASTWKERVAGLRDIRLTGTRNYTTSSFIKKVRGTSTVVSMVCTVVNPSGTTVLTMNGFLTRGMVNFPMGMSTEEVEIVGTGAAPTIA